MIYIQVQGEVIHVDFVRVCRACIPGICVPARKYHLWFVTSMWQERGLALRYGYGEVVAHILGLSLEFVYRCCVIGQLPQVLGSQLLQSRLRLLDSVESLKSPLLDTFGSRLVLLSYPCAVKRGTDASRTWRLPVTADSADSTSIADSPLAHLGANVPTQAKEQTWHICVEEWKKVRARVTRLE